MRIMNYLGLTTIVLLTLLLFPIPASADYGG
jgi:hypothetical protein